MYMNGTGHMSTREDRILSAVIETYVKTARPVSSSAVIRAGSIGLSSATVRNVMRSLEEGGFISQPHTSAGRVPTDKGYRHYVDNLMRPSKLSDRERSEIGKVMTALGRKDLTTVVTEVSKLVSDLTKQLAVAVAPEADLGTIERIELVSIGDERVLAVAAVGSSAALSAVFDVGKTVGAKQLGRATALLNDWLGGVSLDDAERVLRTHLATLGSPLRSVLRRLLKDDSSIFRAGHGERVHYEGARHIFRHPEFSTDAASLGQILDSERALADLLRSPLGRGHVEVTIGSENRRREMQKMSLVVGSYRVGGTLGRIGVIGPTRMRYPRLVGLISHLSCTPDKEHSAG